jgi:hypothetical protein
MEIGPVSNVRLAPVIRSRENDLGLKDVDEIERPASIDDETYSPGSAKAAVGFDEENDDDSGDENGAEPGGESAEALPEEKTATDGLINYFA